MNIKSGQNAMKRTAVFILNMLFLVCAAQSQPLPQLNKYMSQHKSDLFKQARQIKSAAAKVYHGPFDARYYQIHLDIDFLQQNIHGMVQARFTSETDSLQEIILDMSDALVVDSLQGAVSTYNHENNLLYVQLNGQYAQNQSFEIRIFYHSPDFYSARPAFVFGRFPDGSDHLWTLSEPYGARQWWPCKDTPADKADSADIYITVPATSMAASNGLLVSVQNAGNGNQTFHWKERYPIATYLIAVSTGPYYHFSDYYHYDGQDSMLLDYYVYPEYGAEARRIFQEVPDYLDALSYYFGPYPFLKEKYGMVQFPWGGAMENQTLTSITYVTDSWRYVYVHELAHHWFGDAVTCASWRDIWLNEGFATYSEALYAEWAGYLGNPPGMEAYHAYIATKLYTGEGTVLLSDTTDMSTIFTAIVYDKGAWILHMLRHIVGDDNFFTILKTYANNVQWKYGSVRTEDFRSVCEQVSGLDLGRFFDQWLNYPYFPKYRFEWNIAGHEGNNYQISFTLRQLQTTIAYQMPVDISILFSDGSDTTIVVQNSEFTQQYQFSVDKFPLKIDFDRDNWILKESAENLAARVTNIIKIVSVYPNPFNSQVTILTSNWNNNQTRLQVIDVTGKKVTLLEPAWQVGNNYFYRWDGRNSRGRKVSSGIYFIRPFPYIDGLSGKHGNGKVLFIR